MASRGGDSFVLWPRYFDARLSRAEGRRVPKDLAVREPDVKWLESAARKAGLDPVVQADAKHPAKPYRVAGRVLVPKADGKEATIRRVAERMAEGP